MKKWILLGVPVTLMLLRFPRMAGLLLAILVLTLGSAAFNTLCGALFHAPSRACRQQLCERPLRCYLMGVLALAAQVFLVLHWPQLVLTQQQAARTRRSIHQLTRPDSCSWPVSSAPRLSRPPFKDSVCGPGPRWHSCWSY